MVKKRLFLGLLVLGIVLFALSGWAETGTYIRTLNNFSSQYKGCWFCGVFETLLNSIDALAYTVSTGMSTIFRRLLELLLFGYLLWKVGKAVVGFNPINPVEFATDLIMPMLRAIVVVIVLQPSVMEIFFQEIVSPIAEMALGFGIEVQNKGLAMNNISEIKVISASVGGVPSVQAGCPVIDNGGGQVISAGFKNAILCFLTQISVSLINFMSVGATFIADCWGKGWLNFFPNFTMLAIGIIYYLGSFWIFLTFPFKLFDSIIQLMFVLTLMPLWLVLWVLPATRDKSKKAFDMFMGVLINFISFSIILIMVIMVLMSTLDGLGGAAQQRQFFSLLMADKSTDALKMIDWSKTGFWMTVAMFCLANALLSKAEAFGKQFGGSGSMGITGMAAKPFVGLGKAVGSKIVKPLAAKGVQKAGSAIVSGTKKGAKAAARKLFAPAEEPTTNSAEETTSSGNTPPPSSPTPPPPTPSPTPAGRSTGKPHLKKGEPVETNLPGGRKQISQTTTGINEEGQRTHETETNTIVDSAGNTLSKTKERTNYDPKTQQKKETIRVEEKFDSSGLESKIITLTDSNNIIRAQLKKTQDSIKKTSYDAKGNKIQEKTVEVKKDATGKPSSRTTRQKDIDPKTKKETNTLTEEKLDSKGKTISKKETVMDKDMKPISVTETDATGSKKTTYTAKGRIVEEKTKAGTTITEYEGNRKTSVQTSTPSGITKKVEFGALPDQEKKITETDASGNKTVTENTFGLGNKKVSSTTTHTDSSNHKKWVETESITAKTRTDFDAQEREDLITTTNKNTGDVTTRKNIYDAAGKLSGFTTKIENKNKDLLENFTVNLNDGKKIDHLNHERETPYRPPIS